MVVAVFLVYQPAWQGGFLWDDDNHLLNNPVLKSGGVAEVWTPGGYINYWPLTFTVYWLQFTIWGLKPIGFHLVNIAVHAVSALLLWRILLLLGVPGAMFAAAIFALHPVNVESVAWIAQLKGILALMLALLCVLFFLSGMRQGGWWRFALAIGAYLLSTLAKGMVLTLPVVLLACAWWQCGRIGWRDWLHVLPYLLIGAVMAGIEIWTQHRVGADAAVRSDGLLSRTAIAGCAVWFYLGKLIWPLDLCLVYPRWQIDDRDLLSYLPGVLLVMILGLAGWRRRAWGRPVVMLIVCYAGLLLPALGFVNIYFMRYSFVADHYQYAAMVVPCTAFAGAAATLAHWRLRFPRTGYVLCLGLLMTLAVLTWRQSRMYSDAETLYQTTIDRNADCWLAHTNLANIRARQGQIDEAIAHYQAALKIKPDHAEAHNGLGNVLAGRGRIDEAIAHYRKALEIRLDYMEAHYNLGLALAGRGQLDEAIVQYQEALKIRPDCAEVHYNLGNALADRGQVNGAIAHFQMALKINPNDAEAHNDLGNVLIQKGRLDEAIAHCQKALQIRSDFVAAHMNLGNALAGRGQLGEALDHFQQALGLSTARNDRATADAIRAESSFTRRSSLPAKRRKPGEGRRHGQCHGQKKRPRRRAMAFGTGGIPHFAADG